MHTCIHHSIFPNETELPGPKPSGIRAALEQRTERDGFHFLDRWQQSFVLMRLRYHWRELPQVSFLSRQMFCHDKHVTVAKNVLSRQNICHNKYLSRQKKFTLRVCRDKTRLFSRQTRVFCDKRFICRNKNILSRFVAASILLSRQTCVCRDKNYTYGRGPQPTQRPHAYRTMKLAPSPTCNCGLENQTAKHYILQRCPLPQAAQTKCMTDSSPAINIQLYMRQQRGTEKDCYIHLADWTFSVATICSRQQDKKKLMCGQQQSS